jgi:O-antigen/teichoic acid export membrane protein
MRWASLRRPHGWLERTVAGLPAMMTKVALRRLWPLLMLYSGRLGTALVGLLVLPLFNQMLGPEQFGIVAILLSLQTLLVILDLGLSISIGRDVASLAAEQLSLVRAMHIHAEKVLVALYVGILLLTLVARLFFDMPIGLSGLLVTVLLFGAITHQNVSQVALLARQDYAWSGVGQLLAVLLRHLLTLACFHLFAATLDVFLYTQCVGAVLYAWLTRARLLGRLPSVDSTLSLPLPQARQLSMALMVHGIAGACAMQLDKPIVGALAGAVQTTPYYLATVLSLTPLTFLAGPVVQFFQPKLMAALARSEAPLDPALVRRFLLCIIATAFVPGLVLWLAAEPLTSLWLHGAPNHVLVSDYTRILVVGATFGALGYVPHVLLVARQQYTFMAVASLSLTTVTLLGTAWAAFDGDVRRICYIYAGYHTAAAVVLWWRAQTHDAVLRRALLPAMPIAILACVGSFGIGLLVYRFS